MLIALAIANANLMFLNKKILAPQPTPPVISSPDATP